MLNKITKKLLMISYPRIRIKNMTKKEIKSEVY